MRIISQNREVDVNYDKYDIEYSCPQDDTYVIAAASSTISGENRCGVMLGKYPSEERCLEIMSKIRERYIMDQKIYMMPEE